MTFTPAFAAPGRSRRSTVWSTTPRFLDSEPLNERRAQHNSGGGDRALIVEGHRDCVQSGRPVSMHYEGDLMLQAPDAATSVKSAAQRVILRSPTDGKSAHHRWIEAKAHLTPRRAARDAWLRTAERRNDDATSDARKFLGVILLGALVAVWGLFLAREIWGDPNSADDKAFGYLTALLILAVFTLVLPALGRSIAGLVTGKDERTSTSKLQIALWTYAIGFGLLSLIAMTWVGFDDGFDALMNPDFDFEDYLFLLGGPFAAAISARYLIGGKVESGELAKPPAPEGPSLAQAFTDDLVDSQHLLFNIIARGSAC